MSGWAIGDGLWAIGKFVFYSWDPAGPELGHHGLQVVGYDSQVVGMVQMAVQGNLQ